MRLSLSLLLAVLVSFTSGCKDDKIPVMVMGSVVRSLRHSNSVTTSRYSSDIVGRTLKEFNNNQGSDDDDDDDDIVSTFPTPPSPPTLPIPPPPTGVPPSPGSGTDITTPSDSSSPSSNATPLSQSSSSQENDSTSTIAYLEVAAGVFPVLGLVICGAVYSYRKTKQDKKKKNQEAADEEESATSMHRMVTSDSTHGDPDDSDYGFHDHELAKDYLAQGRANDPSHLSNSTAGRQGGMDDLEMFVQTRKVYPQREARDLENIKAGLSAALSEKGVTTTASYSKRLLSGWRPIGALTKSFTASPTGPQEMEELFSRSSDTVQGTDTEGSTPPECLSSSSSSPTIFSDGVKEAAIPSSSTSFTSFWKKTQRHAKIPLSAQEEDLVYPDHEGGVDPEGEGETDSCADHEQGLADDIQLIASVIHV